MIEYFMIDLAPYYNNIYGANHEKILKLLLQG